MNRLPYIAARGVYHLPWLGTAGELYLAAVDRWGRRILEATVEPGQNLHEAERVMLEMLDEHDPPPPLRMVC